MCSLDVTGMKSSPGARHSEFSVPAMEVSWVGVPTTMLVTLIVASGEALLTSASTCALNASYTLFRYASALKSKSTGPTDRPVATYAGWPVAAYTMSRLPSRSRSTISRLLMAFALTHESWAVGPKRTAVLAFHIFSEGEAVYCFTAIGKVSACWPPTRWP